MYRSMIQATQNDFIDQGQLQVRAVSEQNLPVENAAVSISYTGDPETTLEEVHTNSAGQTEVLTLNAPPVEYSLNPDSELAPYAEYTLRISSPGYETAVVSGTELFSRQLSFQTVTLRPSGSENSRNIIVIPAHTLYGNYPPKIAESEVKPITSSGEIVLDRVVVPEYVVVHDGTPRDLCEIQGLHQKCGEQRNLCDLAL